MSACIEFQGYRQRDGYGRTEHKADGKQWRAHRWAWVQAHGPIPDGMKVLHTCDNPPCINEEHLFLGTQRDNVADMEAKGRGRQPRGSANGRAKLTEADIPAIRDRLATGESYRAIGRSYGVGHAAIRQVDRRQAWRYVS